MQLLQIVRILLCTSCHEAEPSQLGQLGCQAAAFHQMWTLLGVTETLHCGNRCLPCIVPPAGALMSYGYSFLAIDLAASGAWKKQGTLAGRPAPPAEKIFGIFNSLGNFGL